MLWDIHTHTSRYSACGRQRPEELVDAAIAVGLQGLVITEHHVVWPPAELAELQAYAGDKLKLLSAAEITCRTEEQHFGDYLVYGLQDVSEAPRDDPRKLTEWAHSLGAFVIAAHPYRLGCGCGDLIYELDVDAVEVWNPNHDEEQIALSKAAAETLDLPATAASDAHTPSIVGYHVIDSAEPVATLEELIETIRTRAFEPLPAFRTSQVS